MSKSFEEVIKNWRRLCCSHEDCDGCTCYGICVKQDPRDYDADYIESVIDEWCEEHPVKTRLDDFIEKYPNAPRNDNGIPYACAGFCGYTLRDVAICAKKSCSSCWKEPVNEK